MAVWTCPKCRRDFGAIGRGHMCTPGLTIDEFLAGSPEFVAPVFEAVVEHLRSIDDGSLIVDPLAKKVLFKGSGTFCILDVKTKWVAVGFSLRRRLESGRLSRKVADYGNKFFHVVNVVDADAVDDEFRGWLTDAFLDDGGRGERAEDAGRMTAPGRDPMIPDDIDFEIAPPPR